MLSWVMEGVDRQTPSLRLPPSPLPVPDVFYADDTILLNTSAVDLQMHFTLLEVLAAQVGMTLNRDGPHPF